MSGSRKRYLAELEQFAAEREQAALEAPYIRFGKRSGLSPGMNRQQTISSLKERSDNAKLETAHGAVGLGGVGLLAARYAPGVKPAAKKVLEHASLGTAVIGGGIGGAYALRRATTDRKNIAAQRQQLGVAKKDMSRSPERVEFERERDERKAHKKARADHIKKYKTNCGVEMCTNPRHQVKSFDDWTKRNLAGGLKARQDQRKNKARYVVKRDSNTPLHTSISEEDAKHLVERHGLTGALPKDLSREQRMAAYEARYVSAGGHKANKWQHRTNVADKVKTGGLAVATAGGAGWLATRGRVKAAPKIISHPGFKHHAETLAGAGATIGGAGELYGDYARRKRSSYASSPSGVAASALRRMQGYNA